MYKDDIWVIPCITGRMVMCRGICHLYKFSTFSGPNITTRHHRPNFFPRLFQLFCWHRKIWLVFAASSLLETGRGPTAETGRAGTRHHNKQGYREHSGEKQKITWGGGGGGRLRQVWASFTAASTANHWAPSEFKGQSCPLYCTCPKEKREMKGMVRLGSRGERPPTTPPQLPAGVPRSSSPDLAYHSQKAASMCPYR